MSAFLFFKVELFKMVEVTDVVTGPVGWLTYKRLTSMGESFAKRIASSQHGASANAQTKGFASINSNQS
jgi:hypothetical protein